MYYERTIKDTIKNVSETFPVLLLTGPRQVGKTYAGTGKKKGFVR